MNEKENSVIATQTVQPQLVTPFELIATAVQSGQIDIETIKELRSLQKDMRADAAKEAFVQAMATFQAECPVIEKTKPVKDKNGQIRYYYAPIDSIVSQVAKYIAKNGLAYTFSITNDDKELTAVCNVTHTQGHTEQFPFRVPIGTESYMTDVQKFGARATFAKRQSFCNAFGITTGDEDTDATQTSKDPAPADVRGKISLAVKALGYTPKTADETHALLLKLTGVDTRSAGASMDEILEKLSILVDDMNSDKSKE